MRTYVYIDGFNLYYGALKNTGYKWLNLRVLIELLVPPPNTIDRIKYFTARVSGAANPDSPRRQQIYLNALRTVPGVEVHFGNFLPKAILRPLLVLPIANRAIGTPNPTTLPAGNFAVAGGNPRMLCVGDHAQVSRIRRKRRAPRPLPGAVNVLVHAMEEKGSDVNLAVHLLNDAWKDLYEAAVVVSNDTDLVMPIQMVTQERRKIVYLVCPSNQGASQPLVNVSTYVRHIRPPMLAQSQLADPIPGTTIRKPPTW
jgi:uncharacterized LabA/DUF88 family protein